LAALTIADRSALSFDEADAAFDEADAAFDEAGAAFDEAGAAFEVADTAGAVRSSWSSRWTGMLAGDVTSATVPRAKVNPVIAPQVDRLTSAVACCHAGFFAEGMESHPSRSRHTVAMLD
jgi:hypothetical protein